MTQPGAIGLFDLSEPVGPGLYWLEVPSKLDIPLSSQTAAPTQAIMPLSSCIHY